MKQTTTIQGSPQEFTWGIVQTVHEIGDYSIVEALCRWDKEKEGRVRFFIYVGGVDVGQNYYTLDEALIGAIAYKYDGLNSQAAQYFCRMVGMGE